MIRFSRYLHQIFFGFLRNAGFNDILSGEKFVDADAEGVAKRGINRYVRQTHAPLPFGNRLVAHVQYFRQFPLRQPTCLPLAGNVSSDFFKIHNFVPFR